MNRNDIKIYLVSLEKDEERRKYLNIKPDYFLRDNQIVITSIKSFNNF